MPVNILYHMPDESELRALIEARWSLSELGEKYNTSRQTVRRWLKKLDLKSEGVRGVKRATETLKLHESIRAMRATGATTYQINKALGCRYEMIDRVCRDMPVAEVVAGQRSKPSAYGYWCANPFGQAVGNVAEGADAFDGHGSTLPV